MTEPERVLLVMLRRKQHAIGSYILDFYCPSVNLCVEVDGPTHEDREEHDARRTAWLNAEGVRVVRFTVADVTERPAWVIAEIERVGSS